jgi:hypothetical protein
VASLPAKRVDLELGPIAGKVTVKIEASPLIATVYTAQYQYTFQGKSVDVRAYTTTPESPENFYFNKTFTTNTSLSSGVYQTVDTIQTFDHNPAPPRRSIVRFYVSSGTSTYQAVPSVKLIVSCPGKPL